MLRSKIIIIILITLALAAILYSRTYYISHDQPQELNSFTVTPDDIHPGAMSYFTFIFNVPMDVSVIPILYVKMPDAAVLELQGNWYYSATYRISYMFPYSTNQGTAEITLTNAVTQAGKNVGDYHATLEVSQAVSSPVGE